MKAYRLWITLLAGLIVVLFMFGRLVRGAESIRVHILPHLTGPTNEMIVTLATNCETIYFQTNVTMGDNSSGCNMCYDQHGNWKGIIPAVAGWKFDDCKPYRPATERWWTTNVVQVSKLKLIWRGEPEELVRTKTVTNVTVRSKLKQEWSEPEADKHDFRAGPVFFATNRMSGIQVKPAGTNWANYDLLVPTNGITWGTNGVYSNLWIAGHMVKIITNANGTFTIEGLPEDKGTK